jgi:hypothetical protein
MMRLFRWFRSKRSPEEDWSSKLQAELRASSSPVSAFFLIDSSEAITRMMDKLGLLIPSGATTEQLGVVETIVRRASENGAVEADFKERFTFEYNLKVTNFGIVKGCLTIRNIPGRGLEAELILPGVLAASIAGLLGDGRDGFFCAFMPPSFYSSLP